jgi:hypothetical protein
MHAGTYSIVGWAALAGWRPSPSDVTHPAPDRFHAKPPNSLARRPGAERTGHASGRGATTTEIRTGPPEVRSGLDTRPRS